MYPARVHIAQTSSPLRFAQTVAFKGNSPAKASLFKKLKHLADSSFTSGRTNSIQKAGQPGSKTQSRSASNAASKANSQVGSRAGSIGSRRDEYDVDDHDDDLEGFIYEDESTSEDEREDYVNAFGRKKKHRNHNDDFSDYEGAGVRALTAGGRVRAALVVPRMPVQLHRIPGPPSPFHSLSPLTLKYRAWGFMCTLAARLLPRD